MSETTEKSRARTTRARSGPARPTDHTADAGSVETRATAARDAAEAVNASPDFKEAEPNPPHEQTLGALATAPPDVAAEYARTGKTPQSYIRKVTAVPKEARDAGLPTEDVDDAEEDERKARVRRGRK